MTLKEKIQRKIVMVEYYRETNCDKYQFAEEFKVTTNLFYDVRKMSNNEEKFQELKARLNKKRIKYKQCGSKNEIKEWLANGIKEMISRGKTNKEISRIFNRKEEEIEKLAGDVNV
jgi:hypothetical protein